MNSQHDLLIQYKKTRRDLVAAYRLADSKADRTLLAQMVAETEFIVEWLATGRRPGSRRGVDRRSVYELTKVWDPEWFKEFAAAPVRPEYELSLSDEFNLDDALAGLSERERQCYVLHVGFDYSMSQVAQELGLKKASVQYYIQQAKQKIERNKMKSLSRVWE